MRKAKPRKRILLPDPKFNDVEVTRFVNNLMLDGKKSIAYTIFYDSLEFITPLSVVIIKSIFFIAAAVSSQLLNVAPNLIKLASGGILSI